jgi:hypothetical protein
MVSPIAYSSRRHSVRDACDLKAQSRTLRCKPRAAFYAAKTTNRFERTEGRSAGGRRAPITLGGKIQQEFESPSQPNRMDARFPQKLLTFSATYGDERVSKSA